MRTTKFTRHLYVKGCILLSAGEGHKNKCFKALLAFSLLLIGNSVLAATLSLGSYIQGAYSGAGPFNVTGTCTDPGDDCGDNDSRIRSADLLQYTWSISASDVAFDEGDIVSVILEQTITPDVNAKVIFDGIPTIYLAAPQGPGGTNPTSSLTDNPDGSITLLCNLGEMGNGDQVSFSVPVRPLAISQNGATFVTEQKVYGFDVDGNLIADEVVSIDNQSYEISASPAFDLMATN